MILQHTKKGTGCIHPGSLFFKKIPGYGTREIPIYLSLIYLSKGKTGSTVRLYTVFKTPAADAYQAIAAVMIPMMPPGTEDIKPNSANTSRINVISRVVNTAQTAPLVRKEPIHI